MSLTSEQRRRLRLQCEVDLHGFAELAPADEFRLLADWCEADDVEHDRYGEGATIEAFEAKVAALLGKPAAVFMPSGVMAQLAAVRIWTQAAALDRFGLHPTSHLALHEEEAYAALLGCHGVPVGDRLRPMLAADLQACRQPLACVIVELPIREAGGQLPTWDELHALQAVARDRGIRLHMDGARLWESAAFYRRTHAEIAAGFDSVYVSVYKGIGGLAGALLAGSDDLVAQARLWRRRLGGTLIHQTPMVASAAMRFDGRLASMPALYERTLALATALAGVPGLRVNPAVPHTNMLHLFVDAPADLLLDARDDVAAQQGAWVLPNARDSDVPGWSVTELYVGDRLLGLRDEQVLALFARLREAIDGRRAG